MPAKLCWYTTGTQESSRNAPSCHLYTPLYMLEIMCSEYRQAIEN